MSFILPIRPSKATKPHKPPKAIKTTRTLQPPPESPRRRPSLATRAGVTKRRSSVSTTFNAPSMSFFEAMFGDDFPDAFAHNGRSCKSKKTLLDLPTELLEIICQHLSKLELKRLRLTSGDLAEKVGLRIDRVFVSPNRANLDCLNSILNHPRYCLEVQELVWDDAQLGHLPTFDSFREHIEFDQAKRKAALEHHLSSLFRTNIEDEASYESIGVQDCVQDDGELTDIGKAILLNADDEHSKNIIASRAASMSVEDSYALYQKLYQDEREIVKRAWDVTALRRALEQLPNLKRITITSEAWRPWNLLPVYDTPFHRALPAGFRKPSVWPWEDCSEPGSGNSPAFDESAQHLPAMWRGYSVVLSALVSTPVLYLQDFIVDTGCEAVGLPMELFASSNLDYDNSIRTFSAIPLKKLHLSIAESPVLRSSLDRHKCDFSLLQNVFSVTPHLEDLDLKWSLPPDDGRKAFETTWLAAHCPRLKKIALRYATVSNDWLYSEITSLTNLEFVVLDKLQGQNHGLGEGFIFQRLQQHYAMQCTRGPSFTWIDHLSGSLDPGVSAPRISMWSAVVDDELNAFLYGNGDIPFEVSDSHQLSIRGPILKSDVGWIANGRDPTVRIKRSNESIAAAMATRDPWPIHGSAATVHPHWRVY